MSRFALFRVFFFIWLELKIWGYILVSHQIKGLFFCHFNMYFIKRIEQIYYETVDKMWVGYYLKAFKRWFLALMGSQEPLKNWVHCLGPLQSDASSSASAPASAPDFQLWSSLRAFSGKTLSARAGALRARAAALSGHGVGDLTSGPLLVPLSEKGLHCILAIH